VSCVLPQRCRQAPCCVAASPVLAPPRACRVCCCRRVNYFAHETTSGLSAVIAAAEADGRVAGYVLDMRNDPGGVFEEAVAIAALFEVRARGCGGGGGGRRYGR
jgi:hypothetical protein